ncbi:MAG: beta-ketoacyl-[acyl-carrier-protein] synthase II [Candidatus Latescibacterota bacterium]|nr:MAG: beta-ketoacyl-[acyl-carrier-protein] synthase II [Candidatus Latescibacterota bacterium]
MNSRTRVVVTGLGVVCPIGNDLASAWEALVSGKNGVGPITRFDTAGYDVRFAAEVREFDPAPYFPPKEIRRVDRYAQFAVAAADMAVREAGLDTKAVDGDRFGVLIGSGIGGMETFEAQHTVLLEKGPGRISPFFIPMMIANMATGNVSIRVGARGPNFSPVSACSSGAHAIGEAFRLIQRGEADLALCGGAEASITPMAVGGFSSMKALSTRNDDPAHASRPFDRERDGFVIGEGAGVVLLESLAHAKKRGAVIHAELAGYGTTGDAYHITAPSPGGEGPARAMTLAVREAGLSLDEIGHINAHGTSTPLNDKIETLAIKVAFGEHAKKIAVSSTKSMTGHLLGAAGGLEIIATVLAVEKGVVPPTINYEHPDPDCDLDYVPNTAREVGIRAALSNSLGFGGHNVSLLVKRFES